MGDIPADAAGELERLRQKCDALTQKLEDADHYRKAVERSPVPMMCVSGPKGRYVFVNEAFAKMLGRTLEDMQGADPFQVFVAVSDPAEFEHERATIGRVARGEIDSYRLEKTLLLADGPKFYQLDAFASRDPQGRLDCITAYFTDLEPQRLLAAANLRAEAELREAQKLGAIGQLAGGIAHDFNNRLVIIMGYGELLKRALPASSALAEHADMVLASAKRAAELTQQLLAYSRRQVLNPAPFNLNEMMARMERVLEAVLGDRIALSTVLGAKRQALADAGQIEQVVLNLALNARDAMPDGGKMVIETRDVTLSANEHPGLGPGEYVSVALSDTGTGIPDDVRPHIFEPFFTTKEKGYGTGLGLSMVEGIVHQSGGALGFETAVGKGTTFTLLLPRSRGSEPPARATLDVAPSKIGNFETVLVCDDDHEVRELMARILGLRAYSVLSAVSGKEALLVAHTHDGPLHLLVTDVAMPEMNGIELAAELRKKDPTLAVLYISGYTENADLLSAPLGPNTYFLAKPFMPGDLTTLVSSILERSTS